MKYYYDTEFLETKYSIDLISIGIVAEDGREYYAVNREVDDDSRLYVEINNRPWLMGNVVPHLPIKNYTGGAWDLDLEDPNVKDRRTIAKEVKNFLLNDNTPVELWAYYGAYDHVVLMWLWGLMIDKPEGLPMMTNDIVQYAEKLGLMNSLPRQTGVEHHADEGKPIQTTNLAKVYNDCCYHARYCYQANSSR